MLEFEWDASKEIKNIQKHKISFAEGIETFFDPCGIKMIDRGHSSEEKRFYWIGQTREKKILTTWFTERGNRIRIIGSAHFRKFRRIYETAQYE